MSKSVAVIGIGRFGLSVIEELSKMNVDVLAIDIEESVVERASEMTKHAVVCDGTNKEALIEAGVKDVDKAIVIIGDDKDKVLSILMLKELGIKHVTATVDDEAFTSILLRVGADEVISPKKEAGRAYAKRVMSSNIVDFFYVTNNYCTARIRIVKDINKTLADANFRARFNINILLITRNGKEIIPTGTNVLEVNDIVTVFGAAADIGRFEKILNKTKES
ncbi:MAG: TrkA family potassium uptake protein [Clostridia bacterium]|nr:TrkA family potassium uptake protein [Clostridia bacterium]